MNQDLMSKDFLWYGVFSQVKNSILKLFESKYYIHMYVFTLSSKHVSM